MWNLEKMVQMIERQMERINIWTPRGCGGGWDELGDGDLSTTVYKTDDQREPAA